MFTIANAAFGQIFKSLNYNPFSFVALGVISMYLIINVLTLI
jgi:hypothetical protein